MSDVTISYKGNPIAEMSASGTQTLSTQGKYCEDDISVDYVKPSGEAVDDVLVSILESRTNVNLVIPDYITKLGDAALYSCPIRGELIIGTNCNQFYKQCCQQSNFTKLTFKGDVDAFNSYNHFLSSSMTECIFEKNVAMIGQNTFMTCNSCMLYDFSHCTSVPSLYNVSSLGHDNNCVIKVPQALLTEWQNATNWCDLTNVVWQGA